MPSAPRSCNTIFCRVLGSLILARQSQQRTFEVIKIMCSASAWSLWSSQCTKRQQTGRLRSCVCFALDVCVCVCIYIYIFGTAVLRLRRRLHPRRAHHRRRLWPRCLHPMLSLLRRRLEDLGDVRLHMLNADAICGRRQARTGKFAKASMGHFVHWRLTDWVVRRCLCIGCWCVFCSLERFERLTWIRAGFLVTNYLGGLQPEHQLEAICIIEIHGGATMRPGNKRRQQRRDPGRAK